MSLPFVAKSVLIAFLAAIAAWMPMAAFISLVSGNFEFLRDSVVLLQLALLGSFLIGLPIAILTFLGMGKSLSEKRKSVFVAANIASAFLLLLTFALGHMFGVVFFGIPILIAANVYALLGWFLVLKPMRNSPGV